MYPHNPRTLNARLSKQHFPTAAPELLNAEVRQELNAVQKFNRKGSCSWLALVILRVVNFDSDQPFDFLLALSIKNQGKRLRQEVVASVK